MKRVVPGGLGLGLESGDKFTNELEEIEIRFEAGDVFLFTTDGLTETFSGAGYEFGEKSLMEILQKMAEYNAEEICDRSIAAVEKFAADSAPHDDITIVAVKIL